jgi:sigma-E factor negative regulatory protein RseA
MMESWMSNDARADAAFLERLSALADGQLERDAAAALCAAWSRESAARSTWHTYHLIGDVLRSEDLAADPVRDAVFLASVRKRLASEPVVLAPASPSMRKVIGREAQAPEAVPARGAGHGGLSWRAPSAVAAAFVAVAGVFMFTRSVQPPVAAEVIAAVPLGAPGALAPTTGSINLPEADLRRAAVDAASMRGSRPDGRLIRDARLDSYLAAHKQFAGSSALGVASPLIRNVTVESADR